jgi:hypothetical protein
VTGPWLVSAGRVSRHPLALARGPPAHLVSLGNEKDRGCRPVSHHIDAVSAEPNSVSRSVRGPGTDSTPRRSLRAFDLSLNVIANVRPAGAGDDIRSFNPPPGRAAHPPILVQESVVSHAAIAAAIALRPGVNGRAAHRALAGELRQPGAPVLARGTDRCGSRGVEPQPISRLPRHTGTARPAARRRLRAWPWPVTARDAPVRGGRSMVRPRTQSGSARSGAEPQPVTGISPGPARDHRRARRRSRPCGRHEHGSSAPPGRRHRQDLSPRSSGPSGLRRVNRHRTRRRRGRTNTWNLPDLRSHNPAGVPRACQATDPAGLSQTTGRRRPQRDRHGGRDSPAERSRPAGRCR